MLCSIDLNNVILVGHSYGGLVIGGVAEKLPHRIQHLVYLDGYVPEDGKSAFDLIPGLRDIYEKRSMKEPGKACGVTNQQDIAWMLVYVPCLGTHMTNRWRFKI